jgi:hypothetical protein
MSIGSIAAVEHTYPQAAVGQTRPKAAQAAVGQTRLETGQDAVGQTSTREKLL